MTKPTPRLELLEALMTFDPNPVHRWIEAKADELTARGVPLGAEFWLPASVLTYLVAALEPTNAAWGDAPEPWRSHGLAASEQIAGLTRTVRGLSDALKGHAEQESLLRAALEACLEERDAARAALSDARSARAQVAGDLHREAEARATSRADAALMFMLLAQVRVLRLALRELRGLPRCAADTACEVCGVQDDLAEVRFNGGEGRVMLCAQCDVRRNAEGGAHVR